MDADIKRLESFAKAASPEVFVKIKVNYNRWQKPNNHECGFYLLTFLHNMINLNEDFREACDFDKQSKEFIEKVEDAIAFGEI
jgi:hypothetical protein